jgi:hypothetical protein
MKRSDFLCIGSREPNALLYIIKKSSIDAIAPCSFSSDTRPACAVYVHGARITIDGMSAEEAIHLTFPCLDDAIDDYIKTPSPEQEATSDETP